jgi:peptidyl-tRNA hydrolase, PTH1 family
MVAAELERRHGLGRFKNKFRALVVEGAFVGRAVILLMPQTYMNLSGEAVGEAARYYHIAPACILAVHDEVELPFGEVRLKQGGGLGGHNGLRSMEKALGSREFWRARLGVGRPPAGSRIPLADFLLSDFSEPEEDVRSLIEHGADAVEDWLGSDGQPSLPPTTLRESARPAGAAPSTGGDGMQPG